MQVGR